MTEQLNISRKNIEGKCDLKCAYNFTYTDAPIEARNSENAIRCIYEDKNSMPVLYNKKKFRPWLSTIYYPSQILYNNKIADAEITTLHINDDSTQILAVIIPIKISNDSSSATSTITNVIKSMSVSAPSTGKNVTISNFNLQNIVPKKPFYSCNINNTNCIIFGMIDAISISKSTFDTFTQIIKRNDQKLNINSSDFSGLYYNSSGPNTTTSLGDGIYISCNPTGNSTETEEVTYETNVPVYDVGNILEDPTFILVVQTIIACIVFIIIFYLWNYAYKFIDGDFGAPQTSSTKD
jgi:hypothetical protein